MIRPATPDDAAADAAIYTPIVRKTAISFEIEPPDADVPRRHIEATLERFPCLVCEREGDVAGYACAADRRARP